MKKVKVLSLVLAAALLLGIAAGCGADTVSSSQTTQAAAVTTAAATAAATETQKKVKITFSWWGGAERADATLAAIDLWNKANPNIQVEGIPLSNEGFIDKLITQLAGGNAPDIFNFNSEQVGNFSDNNQIIDITPHIETYFKEVDKNLWAYYTNGRDQRTWAIPFGQNGDVMVYNKTKFEQFGVRIPTNNETWDSWMELARQMTRDTNNDGKTDFWGYHYPWLFSTNEYYVQQLGYENGFFTEDLKHTVLGDPKVIEGYKKFETMRDYCPGPGVLSLKENETPISAGYVAFQVAAYSNYPGMAKSSKDELGITALPALEGGKDIRTSIGGICFGINAKSPNQEAALKFSSFFVSDPEAGKKLGACRGVLPSRVQRDAYASTLGTDIDSKLALNVLDVRNFVDGLKNTVTPLKKPSAYNEWKKLFDDEDQLYEYKKQTLEQTFRNMVTKGDPLLAK
jgi:ABC-type glycerol-3-phosphate transport system substrate-binding protein